MTALEYNKLTIEANRLGRRMKLLHEHENNDLGSMGEDCDDLPGEISERLFGIAMVLQLLGHTPNAHINTEGMTAIRDQVEAAAKFEKSQWATEVFDQTDP